MIIKLPIPQKISTNKFYSNSIHWSQRKKIADIYHNSLVEHRNKRITNFPCELTFRYTFKKRTLDVANVAIMTKLLEDALVIWDILPDDNIKHVSAHHIFVKKGNEDSVEINIL